MAYGILTQDGTIQFAPRTYRDENTVIYNFSDSPSMMKKKGYLEIVSDTMPDIPEGKMVVLHYQRIDPVGVVSYDPLVGDDGEIMKDENGNVITVENITYDIPEAYIKESFELIDMPAEETV